MELHDEGEWEEEGRMWISTQKRKEGREAYVIVGESRGGVGRKERIRVIKEGWVKLGIMTLPDSSKALLRFRR